MSSRVDGSLCRAMKEEPNGTRRRIEDRSKIRSAHRLTGTAGQDRSDVPLNPITVYLLWPQSYTRAHVAGAYRFSMRHEVIVKQKASIPVANKRGRPCNSSSI